MRVTGDKPVMVGLSLGLGREIPEIIHAARFEMAEHRPEFRLVVAALFDDILAGAVLANDLAGVISRASNWRMFSIQCGVNAKAASIGEIDFGDLVMAFLLTRVA